MSILTRQQFIDTLKRGETVIYKGQLIRTFSQIPSEAELSLGDPEMEAKAKESILEEMERLKAELDLLKKEDKSLKVRKEVAEVATQKTQ